MRTRISLAGLVFALISATAGSALAECGIGNRIWAGNHSTSAKVLAFTTNFWTFKGISTTFEIAGCGPEDNIFKRASVEQIRYYASNNFDRLASDIARGDGENLEAFASLLQLEKQDRAEFKAYAQQNFEQLFPHDNVTAEEFLIALGRRMAESPTLSRYIEL